MRLPKVILASGSKRRSEILTECGIQHDVVVTDVTEIQPKKKHLVSSVMKNAERKVRAAAKTVDDSYSLVIGADTLVSHGSEVIGKPANAQEAKAILRKFSGSGIDVYTGLFLLHLKNNKYAFGYEKSSISVKTIKPHEVDKYFAKLGPFDKAGGFSIEGAGSMIFDDIKGSYYNILGLPMVKLNELFRFIGLELIDFCGA